MKTSVSRLKIFLLLIVFLSSGLIVPDKKTEAVLVHDPAWEGIFLSIMTGITPSTLNGMLPTAKTNPLSLEFIAKTALKTLLRYMTQAIVTWIDSGFQGSPAFITNTGQFLRDTADITIGEFLINDPALSFLCDPFKIQIKLALGLQYRPFQETIRCRFTDALGNVNTALNDAFIKGNFINGGGWDSWLQMTTVPQNNQMGAMIIAQAELDDRIKKALDIKDKELNWGDGFMSWKECPDGQGTADPRTGAITERAIDMDSDNRFARYAEVTGQKRGDDGCVIKTPGGVIANKINWVDTSTLRELELADDFNAIINSLTNQILTMGMNTISGKGLLGNGRPKTDTSYQNYMLYLDQLDKQRQAVTTSTTGSTTSPVR